MANECTGTYKKEENTRLWEEAEILSVLLNDPGIQ